MNLEEICANQKAELELLDLSLLQRRKEEDEFDLDSKLAQVVIGVRRSGKSTLCQKVLLEHHIRFAYINFDDENLACLNTENLTDVLAALYRVYGDFTHLFIDEIQNIKGWPLFVNRLLRQGMKLVITGSNANLLSGELITHLSGRYNQIILYPFSFEEYARATGVDLTNQTTKARALRKRALDIYMEVGGFPELLIEKQHQKYVLSLLSAILSKDICNRYSVRYKQTLVAMANGVLDTICQEVSFNRLAEKYHLNSVHTARQYLTYLANAYLIALIPKYSFKSLERDQARKCYAIDSAFISNHDDVLQSDNFGWRLENCVAIELKRRFSGEYQQIFYLKKSNGFKVDFVVTEMSKVRELIQVTYDFREPKARLYSREVGGLVKASVETGCNNLTLIFMDGEERDIVEAGKTIHCVSAAEWFCSSVYVGSPVSGENFV